MVGQTFGRDAVFWDTVIVLSTYRIIKISLATSDSILVITIGRHRSNELTARKNKYLK